MTLHHVEHGQHTSFRRLLDEWGADSVTALCLFVVLLLAIPPYMSVRALGSIGSVGVLMGMAAFYWWGWYHIQRTTVRQDGFQPVRRFVCLLLVMAVVSYGHAMFHPRTIDEASPADSGLLRMLALAGITLVAHDGIRNLERMTVLVRVLITGAALVSALSLFQFFTGQLWIDLLPWPSFLERGALGFGERSGLIRPTGTAVHPIELASLLTMTLPLALVEMLRPGRSRLGQALIVASIFAGAMISLSRTAIIGLVIGVLVVIPMLPNRWRIAVAGGTVAMTGVLYVTSPGLLGTVRGLFVGLSTDPSVESRTDSFGLVGEFVARSPWVGRGIGTFLTKYRILDNMYLQLLVEIGLLGLAALLALLCSAIAAGWLASRRLPDPQDRAMAMGVTAGITSGAATFAFFDSFAFPQSCFTLFLLVGMAGALWRLTPHPKRKGVSSRAHERVT